MLFNVIKLSSFSFYVTMNNVAATKRTRGKLSAWVLKKENTVVNHDVMSMAVYKVGNRYFIKIF